MPIASRTRWDPPEVVVHSPVESAQASSEDVFTDRRTKRTYDRGTLNTALSKRVRAGLESLTRNQYRQVKTEIENNILFPQRSTIDPVSDLTLALIEASESDPQDYDVSNRREAVTNMAYELGIMQPPCDGQDADEMSIVMLDTADQVRARTAWWDKHKSNGNLATPSLADRHAESGLLSTMCRSIDPERARAIDHHLYNRSMQCAATPRRYMCNGIPRGEIWTDQDWDESGPPDSSGNPLKVSTIHKDLLRLSSNTVFLDPPEGDYKASPDEFSAWRQSHGLLG